MKRKAIEQAQAIDHTTDNGAALWRTDASILTWLELCEGPAPPSQRLEFFRTILLYTRRSSTPASLRGGRPCPISWRQPGQDDGITAAQ
jgi:hypothetical protein